MQQRTGVIVAGGVLVYVNEGWLVGVAPDFGGNRKGLAGDLQFGRTDRDRFLIDQDRDGSVDFGVTQI